MKTNANSKMVIVSVLVLLALCGSVSAVDGNDLISHWKFDEGSGTTASDSAGNNDGTIYGAQWTTGQINGALSFDGNEDYVDCGNDSSLDITDNITISLWFYSESWAPPHGYNGLISKRDDFYLGFDWEIYYDRNHTEIRLWDGSIITFDNLHVNPSLNTWHHLVVTKNGTAATLYLDGNPQGTDTTSNSWDTGSSVRIGVIGLDRLDCGFNGLIDDVAIYNRALSPEEIQQLYQGVFPELVGLEIVGPNEVAENFKAQYKAIAHFDNNSTEDITALVNWSVEPNTAANIDENGILTTKDVVREESATILASYTEGEVTVEAEKAIDILAICPIGTALQFDGVDDYVSLSSLAVTTTEFTIAAWANMQGVGGGPESVNQIFAQRDNTTGDNSSTISLCSEYAPWSSSSTSIRSSNGTGQSLASSVQNYNEWHHYAITVDSSDFIFYIDGVEVGRTVNNQLGDYVTSIDYIDIGRRRYNGITRGFFNGAIDEVAIYNRALSAEEIRANMHSKLTADEPNLVGYWDFDEGEGQIVYDLSGNGNDGQLGSTPEADISDPAWVESDAPVGICSLYQIATLAADGAVEHKTALIEELLAALAEEWTAYEALQEWLENGDYGDLNKGDIVTAKQKIHSATQHEEQSIDALEKSIEKLEDALSALGYEPDTAANIDENGILRTKDIVTHQSATILASYTEGDVTFEAEKAIDILAICPTGTALQFDGVDDYVDCGNDENLDVTELTWSLWIKRTETTYSNERALISNTGPKTGPEESRGTYALQIDEGGQYQDKIQFVRHGMPVEQCPLSKTAINDMNWHHIAVTRYINGDVTIYIDGYEDATGYLPERTAYGKTFIGTGHTSYSNFKGSIDEVAIFNRALSAEEIRANMHSRLVGDEPGLVGYWDFDEGEGQFVYDLSGNGNDGQLGSTPDVDSSDPAWVESDAPVGICSFYQIATMAVERALERKLLAMLEELLAALAEEWTAYEALEELLESGDYGDLNKGDIVTAKQKINSATQHEEQAIDALEKSIEKLKDALSALGYEPPPPPPPPGQASNPNPANGVTDVSMTADLSWTAGSNAVSHDVYFGTTSPGAFQSNQTATTFDPGTMAPNTTYYWRIDEVNPSGTTTGTVWSFRTIGGGGGPPPGPPI